MNSIIIQSHGYSFSCMNKIRKSHWTVFETSLLKYFILRYRSLLIYHQDTRNIDFWGWKIFIAVCFDNICILLAHISDWGLVPSKCRYSFSKFVISTVWLIVRVQQFYWTIRYFFGVLERNAILLCYVLLERSNCKFYLVILFENDVIMEFHFELIEETDYINSESRRLSMDKTEITV